MLDRLLAKRPADRYASPAALAEALAPFAQGSRPAALLGSEPAGERPVAGGPRTKGGSSRRRVVIATAVAALMVSVLVAWQVVIRIRRPDGSATTFNVPKDGTVVVVEGGNERVVVPGPTVTPRPKLPAPPACEPLSPIALVSRPATIPGVRSWTIETRGGRGASGKGAVAYSANGRWLAVAGDDGTIRLHESDTGRLARALVGHPDDVTSLDFSPDSRMVASGGLDGTVRVWEVASGRLLATPHRHGRTGRLVVAFAPDGRTLASSCDLSVMLSDANTFEAVGAIPLPHSVWSLAWSPDSAILATGHHAEERTRLWAADSLRLVRTLEEKDPQVWRSLAAWSPDGKHLAVGSGSGVTVWDATSGATVKTLPTNAERALAWSPDGRLLAGSGGQVWDAASGRLVRDLQAQSLVAWSPDGRRLACSDGANSGIWDVATGQRLLEIKGHGFREDLSKQTVWSADGSKVVSPGTEGGITIWEPAIGKQVQNIYQYGLNYKAFTWSRAGSRIAVCWNGGIAVSIIDVASGARLCELTSAQVGHGCTDIALSPDGATIAIALGERKAVQVRDVSSAGLLHNLEGHTKHVDFLAWSPDGKVLATTESPEAIGECRLWDISSGNVRHVIKEVTGNCFPPAWSPDGRTLALFLAGQKIHLYDTETFVVRRSFDSSPIGPCLLAWSSDGATLAQVNVHDRGDPIILLWDAATGRLRRTIARPRGFPVGVRPDFRELAIQSEYKTLIVETETGRKLITHVALSNQRSLFISPGGHYRGPRGIERELVYVVETDRGQETLAPEEFAARYGWKNDPERVRMGAE